MKCIMKISKASHITFGPTFNMLEYVGIYKDEIVNQEPVFITEPISEGLETAYKTVIRRLGLK